MTKRRGVPQIGELVVCKISSLNPNSAFAKLDEYNTEGIIHISEVVSGWVKDIRDHVKINQNFVAKVIRIDERTGRISLSLRRVDNKQEKEKMKEFKLNQKAEKMLEIIAKEMKVSLNKAYEEVGYQIQESFGSLFDGFKKTLTKPELLVERGIPKNWVDKIKIVAEKNIEQKEFEFSYMLKLKTHETNGIKSIKDVLTKIEKLGLEVKYISAPNYLIKYKTKNAKKDQKEFSYKLDKIVQDSKHLEAEYEIKK